MKNRILLISLFLMLSTLVFGQRSRTNYALAYGEYGYDYTFEHYGSAAAMADFAVVKNLSIGGGLMASTANVLAADVRLNVDIPQKDFFVENRYLGRWLGRYDTQEYTLALSAGYLNDHWKFQFGVYGKFFGTMKDREAGEKLFFEPWGVIYLGEGRVFEDNHCWNIGGRMSNVDYFLIERVTMPLFTLFADVKAGEKTRLFAEVVAHPSGGFNLQAQFYGITTHVGIKYGW